MRVELLPVKPFQETRPGGYCGPASLKMVLGYYGVDKSEKELALRCGHDPERGTDNEAIRRAAESYGFKAEIQKEASFNDIQRWLDKRVPVIVDWFTGGRADRDDSEVPDGHSSVVVGLDESNIYLQDPELGALRTIKREDFRRVWFDFKGEYITAWKDMDIRQLIAVYPRNRTENDS